MERVTFEEYEAAKAEVLYGKEYEETSSMENNVIHKQYVCKDGSGIFYERTENGVTEFWSTEYSKSRKVLKTKEDYYNCLAMVASGELAAADLLAKIESAENQRYIECGVAAVEEEKKAVTVYYCDEAAVGMKFVAGDVSGTVQGVTHIQTDEAAAAGEAGNDRTALTLSKAVKAGCKVIALERTDTVAGMTTDDIAALKGVLKQYE